jgi:hypothetical protein
VPVGVAKGNRLPEALRGDGRAIPAHAVRDGEIVYLDVEGKPQF